MEMATIMTEKMTMKDKHEKVTIKGRPHRQTLYFQVLENCYQVLFRLLPYSYILYAEHLVTTRSAIMQCP